MKWKCAGVLLLLFFAQLVGGAPPAHASSTYDDYLAKTLVLEQKSEDRFSYPCNYRREFTFDWADFIFDPNDEYWSYGGELGKRAEYQTAFNDSIDYGAWTVINSDSTSFDPDANKNITILYSPDGIFADWTGSSGEIRLKPYGAGKLYKVYMQVDSAWGCQLRVWQAERVFNEVVGYTGNSTVKSIQLLFAANVNWSYPVGYAGEYIPNSSPTPPTTPYTGTIDCGGEDPEYMTIYQAGNNGAATLTPISLGQAQWTYNLRDDVPYSFNVECGGVLAAPSGAVSPLPPTSHAWVCDVYGDPPHYCVLS
ncbi:MAG TPA: hypothetical protein VGE13_04260 [Candidatus Saccharimonadales bacterium]